MGKENDIELMIVLAIIFYDDRFSGISGLQDKSQVKGKGEISIGFLNNRALN